MGLNIKLDVDETIQTLVRFIRDYVHTSRAQNVVLGLSGGLDSAVVAALCVRAVGPDKVHAFALPAVSSDASDLDDARGLAARLGIHLDVMDIQPIVDSALKALAGEKVREVTANLMARSRMMLLYAMAQRRGAIVVGTGNKSELLTGYFTKYGDGGVDVAPLGDLYKTQVRALAEGLDVPRRIIDKPPAAGLWAGQTDEGDLGITYDKLDHVLLGLEVGLPLDRIAAEADVPVQEVRRIETKRRGSHHKRNPPLICKIGIRTTGTDWRDPVTGGHAAEA